MRSRPVSFMLVKYFHVIFVNPMTPAIGGGSKEVGDGESGEDWGERVGGSVNEVENAAGHTHGAL